MYGSYNWNISSKKSCETSYTYERGYIMEELVEKIIDSGIGGVIDKRTDALLLNDIEYQRDCKDLDELEEKYMKLRLDKATKMIIDDYIACLDSATCRANDIYYMAGMRDAILFFNKAGLIKESL